MVAAQHPEAWVIGSDQVASLTDAQGNITLLNKPLTIERAITQLQHASGQRVCFDTALSVQCLARDYCQTINVPFTVYFRILSDAEITRYLAADMPLQCAGSFKCESLGISLFERMEGTDQTSLMGLPMLQLCHILRDVGYLLP